MAGDPRFSEISEYLAELLVDTDPSLPSSCPDPDLAVGGVFAAGDVLLGDPSSQNDSFLPRGVGSRDLGGIPPISGGPPDEELVLSTRGSSGEAYSDPLMSLNNRLSPGGESSDTTSDDSRDSDPILKYINQLLMEEDKEVNSWFSGDETALQNTEKSFYDALCEKYPQLPEQNLDFDARHLVDSTTLGKGCDLDGMGGAAAGISNSYSVDPNFICSPGEFLDHVFLNSSYFGDEAIQPSVESLPNPSSVIIGGIGDDFGHSNATVVLAKNMIKDTDSVMQFKKGLEEASKFLPNTTQIFRNLDDSSAAYELQEIEILPADAELSKGLKNHARDGSWVEEGRARKQTAVTGDESGISDMFDKVLLDDSQALSNESSCESPKNSRSSGKRRTSKGNKVRVKKQTSKSTNVDLRSLLALCAEAVNGHDLRTAHELLKQIRENSCPTGDGSERLAHYFANGLEARIAGNEGGAGVFFTSTMFKKTSAADMLKAYHAYITACPFMKLPILFACHMISQLAVNAEVVHIIDFGMAFGFHWPIIIQKLSEHPTGPPKLRMTGIEYPAPGFRPAQRIEEAGRRLAQYCDRFRVPFEFNAVASQEWESIKIEDLKIRSGEMIAVNCLNRFKNLLNDMGEEDSPRDAMLDLVRRINPDIFVNSTPSGAYNSPFFLTRFREALLHHSALYDMLDLTLSADSYERQIIEREFYGREILNVIACEGRERIERPETYKQWQVRHLRAGFKPLPLDQKIMAYLRSNIYRWYHKDFIIDEYKNWMLLGWRGRIMNVSSCWAPC
ncbi:hypothetical protein MLD38_017356 [Melastoma candidum]|uniref:Uncharacterized protein n=1 Tax=Melastoma candidum TaxID=119954 RepID=A0ACB9QQD1_9MYRT|nr:hypothetical protein MLD38_017356 [Melastoma candidum]